MGHRTGEIVYRFIPTDDERTVGTPLAEGRLGRHESAGSTSSIDLEIFLLSLARVSVMTKFHPVVVGSITPTFRGLMIGAQGYAHHINVNYIPCASAR